MSRKHLTGKHAGKKASEPGVFRSDLSRIAKNSAALVVVAGLVFLPALYAWFITIGFWDPYSRTGELKVAVVNEDEGYRIPSTTIDINVGDDIVSTLHANEQFNWRFVGEDEALAGVRSSDYYAAIIISSSFSENLISPLLSNDAGKDEAHGKGSDGTNEDIEGEESASEKAVISYYVNQKENAIAPHITDEGATTLQQRIDESFTESVAQALLNTAASFATQTGGESIEAYAKLIVGNLDAAIAQLDAAGAQADALADLTLSTARLASEEGKALADAALALAKAEESLSSLREAIMDLADRLAQGATSGENPPGTQALPGEQGPPSEQGDQKSGVSDSAGGQASGASDLTDEQEPGASDSAGGQDSGNSQSSQFPSDTENDETPGGNEYLDLLDQELGRVQKELSAAAEQARMEAEELSASSKLIAQSLNQLEEVLRRSADALREDAEHLRGIRSSLERAMTSNDLDRIASIIGSDPDSLAAFLAEPVEINRHPVYAMPNNGSAMSPFYTTLSLWVGSVFLIAIMRTAPNPKEFVANVTNRSKAEGVARFASQYLGRYGIFALIALAQATVVCVGNVYLLHVHCEHFGHYLLACWVTAIVFSSVVYALVASFGNVGKALAVVLLVLQLAGSGGIFPVQMSAPFFQEVYPWLPFTHAMGAIQSSAAGIYTAPDGQLLEGWGPFAPALETLLGFVEDGGFGDASPDPSAAISAFAGSEYWRDLTFLVAFLFPALTLGLALRRPVAKLNEWVLNELEKTGFMG